MGVEPTTNANVQLVDEEDGGAFFVLGAMVGAVAGVALGLLYAPRSGAETRAQIRARGVDAADSARDHLDEARSSLESRADELGEAAGAARSKLGASWDEDVGDGDQPGFGADEGAI